MINTATSMSVFNTGVITLGIIITEQLPKARGNSVWLPRRLSCTDRQAILWIRLRRRLLLRMTLPFGSRWLLNLARLLRGSAGRRCLGTQISSRILGPGASKFSLVQQAFLLPGKIEVCWSCRRSM